MTIPRLALLLGLLTAVLLAVVELRARANTVEYQTSAYEAKARALEQQLRDGNTELHRLRNPSEIWSRAAALWTGQADPAPEPRPAAPARRSRR